MQFSKPVSSGAYKLIVAVLGHERAGEPLKRVFPFWEVVLYGLQMLTNADIKLLVSPPSLSSRWDVFKGSYLIAYLAPGRDWSAIKRQKHESKCVKR